MKKKIIFILSVTLLNMIAGMVMMHMMPKKKEITIDTLE